MGNLTKHAQKELELAGLFDKDSERMRQVKTPVKKPTKQHEMLEEIRHISIKEIK